MEILLPGLRASVTHLEYASGVGSEYQELFVTTVEGKVLKRISLPYNRKMIVPVDKVPVAKKDNLPDVVPDFAGFFPGGKKVPMKYLEQIVQFFKAFMKMNPGSTATYASQHSYEAMAHIVWNPDTGYRVAIPTQVVSGAHVSYEWDHLEPNDVVLVDIHSHNSMGAFFSGTDNGDDVSKLQFSGVIGQLDKPTYATKWRFNDTKSKYEDIPLTEIFEAEPFEVPKAWMDRVSIRSYQQHGNVYDWRTHGQGKDAYGRGYYQNPNRNDKGQFTTRKRGKTTSILARKVGDPVVGSLPSPQKTHTGYEGYGGLSLDDLAMDLGSWDNLPWPEEPQGAPETRGPVEPKWLGEDDITKADLQSRPMPYCQGLEAGSPRFINAYDDVQYPSYAGFVVLNDQYDYFEEAFEILERESYTGDVWVDTAYCVPMYVMEDNRGGFMACVDPEPEYISMMELVYIPVLVGGAEKERLEALEGGLLEVVSGAGGVATLRPAKSKEASAVN